MAATDGSTVSPGRLRGRAVIYIYPYTGKPDVPDPPGWDAIFGAHGSTPQSLAYSELYPEFRKHFVKVFGLSNQSVEWQKDFVARNALAFSLLSDVSGAFAAAVPLAMFKVGANDFYVRRSFLIENGEVLLDRTSIYPPDSDAEIMLADIRRRWS